MEIRYTLTPRDFAEGNTLLLQNSTFRRRFCYWQYTWLGPLVGIVLLGLGTLLFVNTYRQLNAVVIVNLVMGVVCLSLPFRYRRMLKSRYKMQKLDREIGVIANSEGVEVRRMNGDAETRYSWSAFEKRLESERLFVLFPSQVQFLPIPKHTMSPEQIEELRNLLIERVPGV